MNNKNTFDSFIKNKILPLESLKKISSENKKNKKIIHCHGTFDLLHTRSLQTFSRF